MSTHIFLEYLLCSRHYSGCLGIDGCEKRHDVYFHGGSWREANKKENPNYKDRSDVGILEKVKKGHLI